MDGRAIVAPGGGIGVMPLMAVVMAAFLGLAPQVQAFSTAGTAPKSGAVTSDDADPWDALQGILDWLIQLIGINNRSTGSGGSLDAEVASLQSAYAQAGLPPLSTDAAVTLSQNLAAAEQIVQANPGILSADGTTSLLTVSAQMRSDAGKRVTGRSR